MTLTGAAPHRRATPDRAPPPNREPARPRIGIHGRLGSGNLGNDGSLEALLAHLRSAHVDADIDVMCSGPDVVAARYSLPARQMHWLHSEPVRGGRRPRLPARAARVAWGAAVDTWTTARWVRDHDFVIIPGMGTLETTLPVKPWQLPAALFCVSLTGRLTGVRVAYVSVGASRMRRGLTRWLLVRSARLAHYRSFRDEHSRDEMARLGVPVEDDEVYPDLAFALPAPKPAPDSVPGSVGVGVIDLASGDRTGQVGAAYEQLIVDLVLWLVDHQRPVRLLVGDRDDEPVARAVLARVGMARPDLSPTELRFTPATTLDELSRQIGTVDTVVASRFHNVLCAVKAAKPTLSLGYAAKHRALMASVGTPDLALDPREASLGEIVALLERLDGDRTRVVSTLAERTERFAGDLERQFEALDAFLTPSPRVGVRTGARCDRIG